MYHVQTKRRHGGHFDDMINLKRLFQTKPVASRWAATHRHKKGGLYRLTGKGVYEPDRSPVAIYDDAEGTVWIRPWEEFHDGRFTPVA